MKKTIISITPILISIMIISVAFAESISMQPEHFSENSPISLVTSEYYEPLSVIVDADSIGYIYDDMNFSLQCEPSYYYHSTFIRKWNSSANEGEKVEMNIQVSINTRLAPESDQITGWNIYSDDQYLFSLSLYNEILYQTLPKLDRIFVALLDDFDVETNCLICIPCYNNEYESIDESYGITSGNDLYFFHND